MTRLAATAPGLENERMLALMRATASSKTNACPRHQTNRHRDRPSGGSERSRHTRARSRCSKTACDFRSAAPNPPPDRRHAASERSLEANAARGGSPPPHDDPASQRNCSDRHGGQQQAHATGPLDTIFARHARPKDQGSGGPWDPPPYADGRPARRLRAANAGERRDERALGRAEKSGRAALDALEAFRTGEGAT